MKLPNTQNFFSPHISLWALGLWCGWIVIVVIVSLLLGGCGQFLGNIHAADPIERGLSSVGAAIVTAAVIRAFFNR